ncbi:Lsm4 protein-like [Scleropages formosus]|uniref:U6 snRNA-associated Sm-like protein LSm4 n=1 Tax=Scleropages formosus TaxID=113540 RepID=A0A0P7VAQ8_SCLFO|nr:Lsm4 protein-like [Scleropages formosus]
MPLSLLKTAQNHPMFNVHVFSPKLVELKNGETYNGHLVSCDNWMNINLREVICTSRVEKTQSCATQRKLAVLILIAFSRVLSITQDGDKFWRMPECYIRGSTIKYLRIPDEIIDMVKEEVVSKGRGRGGMQQNKMQQKGRGGGTGRGVFGGRGRGMSGAGRGQQDKKPGKPQGGKNQH